ncbi:MAG TPA: energy transducer TonB [Leptospiraceae bacterium]|nr:energy transducer TonB [Leptospiraceae bacterium]HMY65011.1 energy transducer TonB [Leptospiraceae bacterium]HNF12334.1 energy transducer TonB [Leptospiraceae bacterium]HNF22882.1 energy transducer TonB [Leptospiraceae bacterium]HNM01297.1 energy transducer TonB [Leptospiraceae bacterium]
MNIILRLIILLTSIPFLHKCTTIQKNGIARIYAQEINDGSSVNHLKKVKMLPVQNNGKCGFIDENGRMLIEPKYQECSYGENFTTVNTGKKQLIVLFDGTETPFSNIDPFYDGIAVAKKADNDYDVLVDENLNIVSKLDYEYLARLSGKNVYAYEIGGKYSLMDSSEDSLTPEQFDSIFIPAYDEDANIFRVKRDDMYSFIKENGKLFPEFYQFAYDFSHDFALVRISENNYQFINRKGKPAFKDKNFFYAESFQNGFARIFLESGKNCGFLKTDGNYALEPADNSFGCKMIGDKIFFRTEHDSEKQGPNRETGFHRYYSADGKLFAESRFITEKTARSTGRIEVKKTNTFELSVPADSQNSSFVFYHKNQKMGLYSLSPFQEIIPPVYDQISYLSQERIVGRKSQWAQTQMDVLDIQGKQIASYTFRKRCGDSSKVYEMDNDYVFHCVSDEKRGNETVYSIIIAKNSKIQGTFEKESSFEGLIKVKNPDAYINLKGEYIWKNLGTKTFSGKSAESYSIKDSAIIIDSSINRYFPSKAKQAGISNRTVILSVEIDENGNMKKPEIVSGRAGYGFDEAALDLIQKVKWVPGTKDGKPETMKVSVPVYFKLN